MRATQNLYGLVLCGGKSSRMGEDKSFIAYHKKPQCYHVYEMLQQFCLQTFISCNQSQATLISNKYNTLIDKHTFANRGPASGVLTAFDSYPGRDFLVIACDYPLLTQDEIRYFLESVPEQSTAAAFYDERDQSYQPVLAWYSAEAGDLLIKSESLSLKQLLQISNAYKHYPVNASCLTGADTQAQREKAMMSTNLNH